MKGFVDFLFDNDEKVASRFKKKKQTYPYQGSVQRPFPIKNQNGWKAIPFGAADTYVACIREYLPPIPHPLPAAEDL